MSRIKYLNNKEISEIRENFKDKNDTRKLIK